MTTLYDVLQEADAIEIDDHFIRHFGGIDIDDLEEDEGDEAICMHIRTIDENYTVWEWVFTIKELKDAVHIPETNEWEVRQENEPEPFMVTAYLLETMGE